MVFSSLKFLFFFLPIVFGIYFAVYNWTKRSARHTFFLNVVLLLASIEFYLEGEKHFFWVMLVVGGMDYLAARWIYSEQEKNQGQNTALSRGLLWISILGNMGLLFYFKYAGFMIDLVGESLGLSLASKGFLEVTLPIGISFYTFESMSYTIDVYRREVPPSKHIVDYWAFITFFPHLIAGPIIRYADLHRQLQQRSHSVDQVYQGIHRFIIGLGKKVIIANPMAYQADYLFSLDPSRMDASSAWLAAICYTFQIYFDFSGYSDMAIGLGKIVGIELPENFNYPYVARSVQDFWRRWHMTLSRWFRDYMYIPLGGNQKGPWTEYRNLLLVFFICGLWHGASLNFVAWGLWHGFFLVIERLFRRVTPPLHLRLLAHIYTLLVVIFGWVLFRAETLEQALRIWKAMLSFRFIPEGFHFVSQPSFYIYLILALLFATPVLSRKVQMREIIYLGIFALSVCFLCGQEYNPFIYFRF